jgi:hypothetical protein
MLNRTFTVEQGLGDSRKFKSCLSFSLKLSAGSGNAIEFTIWERFGVQGLT